MATVTMRDVADRAGVSKTTVSHVLNETRFVEEETVARVRHAIRELGYRRNLLARSLRRQKTNTIGLIIPDNANVYWAELARAVEGAGFAEGYAVLLCNSAWSTDRERTYVETLLAKQIDGIILAAVGPKVAVLSDLIAANLPVVMMNAVPSDQPVSVVKVNNERGGYLAGEYLVRLGHHAVGCIGAQFESDALGRVQGFCQAFVDAGITIADTAIVEGDFGYASGETSIQTLLNRHPALTAVFATNDIMALGAYKGLRRLKRRIPEDISVIGFDNIFYATAVTPELTTVAQPVTQQGAIAFQLLLKKIEDPTSAPETVVLEPTLIERESCQRR